tara:strand:+ start:243 stop:482 length:240 start_codon:yes stop_codon:yes gene_type:complete
MTVRHLYEACLAAIEQGKGDAEVVVETPEYDDSAIHSTQQHHVERVSVLRMAARPPCAHLELATKFNQDLPLHDILWIS